MASSGQQQEDPQCGRAIGRTAGGTSGQPSRAGPPDQAAGSRSPPSPAWPGRWIRPPPRGARRPTPPAGGREGAAKAPAGGAGAELHISPGGGHNVNPSQGITVTAASGKIQTVSATSGHQSVSGSLNGAKTVWRHQWALQPSRDYTVRATAVNSSGTTVTSTRSFRTLTPAASDTAMIFEGYKQSYGVGIPIRITFSSPVTNEAARS